jgi:oligopeptide/dipeptide ABC transporter ATP-binding protein
MPLIEVKELKKYFPIKAGFFQKAKSFVHAVDGISLSIDRGKPFGLVGESGCGKTTAGNCILRLLEPTEGEVYFNSINILKLKKEELRKIRPRMQIVFQNPYASLNPRKTVRDILGIPFKLHTNLTEREIENEILKLLESVGLDKEHIYRYPYEFSGGQRQRIAIARAIALKPEFVFLDEPTSSLDMSVQAQILNLLSDLREKFDLTYLFATHNIDLIRYMTDELAVMYVGKIVEMGSKEEIFSNPLHPYTKALFSANPIPNPDKKIKRIVLKGEVPTPVDPPPGCRFFKRCGIAEKELCDVADPDLVEVGDNHRVACYKVK